MFIQKLQAHDREHALEKATPLRLNFQNQIDDFLSDHSESSLKIKRRVILIGNKNFLKNFLTVILLMILNLSHLLSTVVELSIADPRTSWNSLTSMIFIRMRFQILQH